MNIKHLLDEFENSADKLPELLQLVVKQQNEYYIQKIAQILAKHNCEFDQMQQSAIIDFVSNFMGNQNEEISIKLISTLLHLINKKWMNNCCKLFNLFLEFSFSENSIVQSSAIQGLILIIENLEDEILFQVLELFFIIYQDKIQTQINSTQNTLLCKDIFILLLKKEIKTREFKQFLNEKLMPYAQTIDINSQSNALQQINSINFIFTLLLINEENVGLLNSIIIVYENQQIISIVKIAIHDGFIQLFQSEKIVLQLLMSNYQNGKENYFSILLQIILQHSIFQINEYEVTQVVKQTGLLQNFSAKYLDYLNQSIENKYIQQITQIIIILVERTLISETFNDQKQKQLFRPIFKLLKQVLDISNQNQHEELLQMIEKWIKCQLIQLDLALKIISDQSKPKEKDQLIEAEEKKQKWYNSFKLMLKIVQNNVNDCSASSWNIIVTLFQYIENLHLFEEDITKFYISSSDFEEQTLLRLIDGLSQQILKVSEKISIQFNQIIDICNLKKLFALDKIILIIQSNYFRLEQLWPQIEALFLCLCSSKSLEIRNFALNSLKSVVCQCFHNGLLTNEIFNPINELINSRYDDVVEYVMNLLFFLIKQDKIQDKFYIGLIKIFETLLNEQEEFIHLVLCLNCLNELIFNQLEHLNDVCIMRLSSLMVYLTKYLQKQYHMEIKNKIICMIWQLQLQSIIHKLNNPSLWNLSLKLIKNALENQGELKFAAIHITSQFCLISQNEQFKEIFELFEELINLTIVQYQRVEFQQIALFNNTPRFNNFNVIETPKFQVVSLKFDKQTIMEQFKQSLEILKLCIQLWTEVIIQKNQYEKFFYFFQSFNQAQLVYIKHELVISFSKILNHSKQQLNIALDFIYSIFDNETIDVQYFLDNDTFQYVCQILKLGFQSQYYTKCFFVSAKLFLLVCTDNYLSDNLILKYYMTLCLPQTLRDDEEAIYWLDFINEQFSQVGVQLRYHKLLEMLATSFDLIIKQIKSEKVIDQIQKFVKQLIIQLNKSQRFANDNSERLQLMLSLKIKEFLPLMLPTTSTDLIRTIVEQIFTQNRKMTDWIKYFLSLNYNDQQKIQIIEQLTELYINWITKKESIPQQTSIINIISLLEDQNQINQVVFQQIKTTLLYSIYKIIDQFIDVEEYNNEEIFNVGLMIDFIMKEEKFLHPSILKIILCPQQELRLKIIDFLKKFQPL